MKTGGSIATTVMLGKDTFRLAEGAEGKAKLQGITMSKDDLRVPDNSVLVTLSEEDIALADEIAEARVAPYLRGEKWEVKPWRLHELTEDECREWLASRKDAGREIDVGTCEIGRWYVNWIDPYGIREALGEPLPEEYDGYIEEDWFVRSPESRGWVNVSDLPEASAVALHDRINRNRNARVGFGVAPNGGEVSGRPPLAQA